MTNFTILDPMALKLSCDIHFLSFWQSKILKSAEKRTPQTSWSIAVDVKQGHMDEPLILTMLV